MQTKTTHTKQSKESTKLKSEPRDNLTRKRLVRSSIIAVLIAITPYIFQLYESVPTDAKWENFLFSFESNYYKNAQIVAWVCMNKLVPLLLLIIWFITCKNWWYHIILIPIAMFAFQFIQAINDESRNFDELEIYWLIPIMMIIVPIVYLIRIKLFDKLVYGIDLTKIEAELEEYKRKEQEQLNTTAETQKQ
ncbi:MAG: hypothetical protein AAF611_22740 [Bacteroidota bacterium]